MTEIVIIPINTGALFVILYIIIHFPQPMDSCILINCTSYCSYERDLSMPENSLYFNIFFQEKMSLAVPPSSSLSYTPCEGWGGQREEYVQSSLDRSTHLSQCTE